MTIMSNREYEERCNYALYHWSRCGQTVFLETANGFSVPYYTNLPSWSANWWKDVEVEQL